jgi:hypothetical protein
VNLLDLYQQGVRVIRAMCFACDVPGRRVLLQRRLWPSWERSTYGGGDEATYVLSGIEGRIPLTSDVGTAWSVSQLFQSFTGLSVPAADWKLVLTSEIPPRVHRPIPIPPEHPSPVVVYAAAVALPEGVHSVQSKLGDCIFILPVDRALLSGFQQMLDPVPEMVARAFQAVGG